MCAVLLSACFFAEMWKAQTCCQAVWPVQPTKMISRAGLQDLKACLVVVAVVSREVLMDEGGRCSEVSVYTWLYCSTMLPKAAFAAAGAASVLEVLCL